MVDHHIYVSIWMSHTVLAKGFNIYGRLTKKNIQQQREMGYVVTKKIRYYEECVKDFDIDF